MSALKPYQQRIIRPLTMALMTLVYVVNEVVSSGVDVVYCRDSWLEQLAYEDFAVYTCSKCFVQVFWDEKNLTLKLPPTYPYLLVDPDNGTEYYPDAESDTSVGVYREAYVGRMSDVASLLPGSETLLSSYPATAFVTNLRNDLQQRTTLKIHFNLFVSVLSTASFTVAFHSVYHDAFTNSNPVYQQNTVSTRPSLIRNADRFGNVIGNAGNYERCLTLERRSLANIDVIRR
ncbi:hypothetical protein LSH36_122g01003 [Paralvinella palmiformis]|uniref:Uncharacterized protein n=1 Tax=Paralvinella palmiformis TaxID=53620 RepID=A0AAD9JX80_9ANNE|nr:hypothetical protein LSH36_122g01003 [Paralvinella palmiformis]